MDNLPGFQPGRRTPSVWLKKRFEDRTLAEMSVWYYIVAGTSLFILILVLGVIGGLPAILPGVVLWPVFAIWLWIDLVRVAWKSGPERMETSTFKYLQIAFVVMTVWIVFAMGGRSDDSKIIPFVLLMFDAVVMGMALVFLLLAWCSRSRVPRRTYREILTMVLIFAFQIYLAARGTSR